MKLSHQLLIVCLCVFSMGFKDPIKTSSAGRPSRTKSDATPSSQSGFTMPQPLSELIVSPSQIHIPVENDPFRPVVKVQPPAQIAEKALEGPSLEFFKGMKYAGMVKWGDKFSVLIKTGDAKGVYQISDRIQQWTIINITESIITFQNGKKIYQLQRGDR